MILSKFFGWAKLNKGGGSSCCRVNPVNWFLILHKIDI
jgi:hypothetical protein